MMTTNNGTAVFVDTSGWADPILQNSSEYEAMTEYSRQLLIGNRRLVTTNYVITELVALLTARAHSMPRADLVQFVNHVQSLPQLELVHVDPTLHAEAWAMLERMTDKDWSLVDAASFVVTRRLGIVEAFTSDHHFTQAGFVRVPALP